METSEPRYAILRIGGDVSGTGYVIEKTNEPMCYGVSGSDCHVWPVSMIENPNRELRYLEPVEERRHFHFCLSGYEGGYICYLSTYEECLDFVKRILNKVILEILI